MAFPFAGFGPFLFKNDERPIDDSDSDWNPNPTYQRSRSLGTRHDRIQAQSIGSFDRSFEMLFEPSRFSQFQALINTQNTFTDWTRPTPDTRTATLLNVRQIRDVAVICSDGATRRKIRAIVTLAD